MKLPGITPDPCRIQTAPAIMANRPRTRLRIRTLLQYARAFQFSRAKPKSPLAGKRARRASRPFGRIAPAPYGRGASTRAHRHFARGRRGALDGAPARLSRRVTKLRLLLVLPPSAP